MKQECDICGNRTANLQTSVVFGDVCDNCAKRINRYVAKGTSVYQ